jgi:hypothetical protein
MSQPKLKPPAAEAVILPLRRRRESTAKHIIWGMVPPKGDESCRWETLDGRWVALAVGSGGDLGRAIVTDSSGRRELVQTYEEGLALARTWRS